MDDINAQSFALEARNESAAGRAANYNSGNEAARGLLARDNAFGESLGGGPDPAMSAAIRNKYAGQFGQKMGRLNLENVKAANSDHLKKMEVATQMANEEHQMNFQKEMMRKKAAQAKQMMRAQLVGTVLGIVGGVAGGAATMSPQGAMAGMALGQGAGQAIGGGMG